MSRDKAVEKGGGSSTPRGCACLVIPPRGGGCRPEVGLARLRVERPRKHPFRQAVGWGYLADLRVDDRSVARGPHPRPAGGPSPFRGGISKQRRGYNGPPTLDIVTARWHSGGQQNLDRDLGQGLDHGCQNLPRAVLHLVERRDLRDRGLTWRFGEHVGNDALGNRYYRTKGGKIDPALGFERRWVLYNGLAEASKVGPDWHGWLHHTSSCRRPRRRSRRGRGGNRIARISPARPTPIGPPARRSRTDTARRRPATTSLGRRGSSRPASTSNPRPNADDQSQ